MAVSGAKAIDRAAAFAWAALELLKAPVTLSKRKIYIGASIGIASGARRNVPVPSCFAGRISPCTTPRRAGRGGRPGMTMRWMPCGVIN